MFLSLVIDEILTIQELYDLLLSLPSSFRNEEDSSVFILAGIITCSETGDQEFYASDYNNSDTSKGRWIKLASSKYFTYSWEQILMEIFQNDETPTLFLFVRLK